MIDILDKHLSQSQLQPTVYTYIENMIQEEPPQNPQEMFELIGPFVINGNHAARNDAIKICESIFHQMNALSLIKKENKHAITAELIGKEFIIKNIDISSGDNRVAGYEDLFRGTKRTFNTNEEVSYKNKGKKDKELQKQEEMYLKYIEQIKNSKTKIPPPTKVHTREIGQKSMDLFLDNLNLVIAGRTLLEETQMKLVQGRKYGLIGRNGIGKTCLMNALARKDFEKIPKHLQILLVEQEIEGNDLTALDLVLETDVERTTLLKQLDSATDAVDINKIQVRLNEIEAHMAESIAQTILAGLGFSVEMMSKKTKDLSGGWRMRVSLARALYVQPDVLLLDEPTNHLDLDAVMWLEDYVINAKNTILIVSHAREFLNVVCSDVIHFFDQKLITYKGNYDTFEKTRGEKLNNLKKQQDAQQMKVQHMQSFIDKFRYNAKRASLVQSRLKALQKMSMIEDIVEDPTCVFIFPTPEKLRPPLLKIEEGFFGYDLSKTILRNINIFIEMETRIAIVGANGVGKSTLLKLLVEQLKPSEGNYYKNPRLRLSLFTQHHMDQLNLMLSPLEQLMTSFPGGLIESYRNHLGQFGLIGNLQLRPQYLLSGGQKSRVSFAMAVWNNPHILIMDEPTNHLDIDAVNALIVALNNYSGGLIIVSHDQYFVQCVCDSIYYIKDQRLKQFNGDFDDYRKALSTGKLQ